MANVLNYSHVEQQTQHGRPGDSKPLLYEYGIWQEKSDIRAHVSVPGKHILVFKTSVVRWLLTHKNYKLKTASQPGIKGVTALGWPIPIDDIKPIELQSDVIEWERLPRRDAPTNVKGDAAVQVVVKSIIANKFPLWLSAEATDDPQLDISGTDILVNATRLIQVKYDWLACSHLVDGSDKIFIQYAERNPRKLH